MRAAVVALGKVGLPLAAKLTLSGHHVAGCDIDGRVVSLVAAGEPPFPGEFGLAEALQAAVAGGLIETGTETAAMIATHSPELIVAVPPLYVDERAEPEWSILDSVVEDIGRGLSEAVFDTPPVVAIETTVPVGSTRNRISPALERASGLSEGKDFHTVFSPERVFSGRALADLDAYPKLIGGLTADGEHAGAALYRQFLAAEVVEMGGAEAAEFTKLAETTYRDVNIAYANELAAHADELGIDVLQVIDAANSQPYSHIHRPGIAVGGHCIPVYPRFLLKTAENAHLPRIAREVNDRMPAYATSLLGEVRGRRVLILGVAYRGGVKETAFSGAFPLRDALVEAGAHVVVADPLYNADELQALGFTPWEGEAVDAAVVQADHTEYRALDKAALPGVQVVVDGRGVIDPALLPGVSVRRIGRPDDSSGDSGSPLAPGPAS